MSETVQYTIAEPSLEQLVTSVQPLRHDVLDQARLVPTDKTLSVEDFLHDVIHRAAFIEGVAVSAVRVDTIATNSLHAMIRKMATLDGYSKLGIGSKVLGTAEEQAAQQGVRNFWLDARESAIPFFEKNGYMSTNNTVTHEDGVLKYRMFKRAT